MYSVFRASWGPWVLTFDHLANAARRCGGRAGLASLLLLGVACDTDPGSTEFSPPTTLVETGTIILQETDSVVSVRPSVWVGPDRRLYVAEPSEGSVRVHGANGELLAVLGRRGEGPGEFTAPVRAVGLADTVWVLDLQRGISAWVLGEEEPREVHGVGHALAVELDMLEDSLLVIGGFTPAETPWRLLRVLNRRTWDYAGGFLQYPVSDAQLGLAMTLTSVPFAATDDGMIAAMHSWSDTLQVLNPAGDLVKSIPLPIPGFRTDGSLPNRETLASLRVVRVLGVGPVGHFVVQYAIPARDQQDEEYGLLLVSGEGVVVHHEEVVPRLLSVRWPEMIFADSTGLRPNRLTVMEYRE